MLVTMLLKFLYKQNPSFKLVHNKHDVHELTTELDSIDDAFVRFDSFESASINLPSEPFLSTDGNRSPDVEAGISESARSEKFLSLYFQNVNRLRTKTSELYKSVLKNDFDVIVLLETNLVEALFFDEEMFDSRYFVYRCDRNSENSLKKSGGGVLIAIKKIYDSVEVTTKNQKLIEHMCIKVKCNNYFYYISAVYLAPNIGKSYYELYIEDIEEISSRSEICDSILVLGDFNLPKLRWRYDDDDSGSGGLLPLNVTTDLENDFINGLFACDLSQINFIPNDNGTYLDLIFSNSPNNITVENCENSLLKMERHHKAYEVILRTDICVCDAAPQDSKQYKFHLADCDKINSELNSIEWEERFRGMNVDSCVDLFYSIIWDIFDKCVPSKMNTGEVGLPWMSKELSKLKNQKSRAAKKLRKSAMKCTSDPSIDECECERLQSEFSKLRTEYQIKFDFLTTVTSMKSRTKSKKIQKNSSTL
jgi:Endonuclease-reverse transcriptase